MIHRLLFSTLLVLKNEFDENCENILGMLKFFKSSFEQIFRVGLLWQKLEWEWKLKGKSIALFALNVPLHGCDF